MGYDVMIIAAHPDDAEVQMGGTIVKLVRKGHRVLIVDLCDGEPTEFAERGVRHGQAMAAAQILGADRLILDLQDRLIEDTLSIRLRIADLIRTHRPRGVFGTAEACIRPDHAAVEPIVTAAVFDTRLDKWEQVPGRELLANTQPWIVDRLFFAHCKMEPAWGNVDFAVDVSGTYAHKQATLAQPRVGPLIPFWLLGAFRVSCRSSEIRSK